MTRIRRALISLTDKRGAAEFAAALAAHGAQLLSTGNTARILREAGLEVTEVQDFTGFPEMLDGRVKTLHPKVHGGLLARRDDESHLEQMREHGLEPIDLVAVNLYPFERATDDPDVSLDVAIENIDIGGPSLLRSAAKNHAHVAVVVDPDDYGALIEEMAAGDGALSAETRRRLARKAFERTAAYDAAISAFLRGRSEFGAGPDPEGPEDSGVIDASFLRLADPRPLRYGENPHQPASFIPLLDRTEPSLATARQLSGKELSYNNILDSDAALALALEFDAPACAIIKHTNPCGCATGETPLEAFSRALAGDPVSAFGGIVAMNREVTVDVANALVGPDTFFECILAPSFTEDAAELLQTKPKWGKNVRLLAVGSGVADPVEHELRKVRGGLLVQARDVGGPDDPFDVVTKRAADDDVSQSMRFAWIVAKHVKSNAIVLVRDQMLVGTGAGQMSRVDSVEIAVKKAGERAAGSVLGSDAFFPFRDGIDAAAAAGVVAVAQPGGSRRDDEVIAACDEHHMVMAFTGSRHFRH